MARRKCARRCRARGGMYAGVDVLVTKGKPHPVAF